MYIYKLDKKLVKENKTEAFPMTPSRKYPPTSKIFRGLYVYKEYIYMNVYLMDVAMWVSANEDYPS